MVLVSKCGFGVRGMQKSHYREGKIAISPQNRVANSKDIFVPNFLQKTFVAKKVPLPPHQLYRRAEPIVLNPYKFRVNSRNALYPGGGGGAKMSKTVRWAQTTLIYLGVQLY